MATGPPSKGVLEWLGTPQAQKMAEGKGAGLKADDPRIQDIVDRFPEFATMLQIPEIADLLVKASAPGNNWTPEYFREQLWHTKWWKSTPESARQWQTRKLVDPATAGLQARQLSANIIGTAQSLGINLTPGEVAWYTEFAGQEGWDETMLTRAIVDTHKQGKYHAGTVNATKDSLKGIAADYGIKVSDASAFKWATNIATGRQTQDGFQDFARNQAKGAFPQLIKEIDSGLTVKQIADPYMQQAADLLGLNPETMLLSDPKWQRALHGNDVKGNPTGRMSMQDWQRHIMTDPSYGYGRSANGRLAALQLRDSLAKTFGLEAS